MHAFHLFVIEKYRLNKQANLFGFSRGGLYAFNYALFYPEYVAKVYLDAPVLDMKTWPPEGSVERGQVYDEYCLNKDTFEKFTGNPVDNLEEFFALGIPLMVIAGVVDSVVPYKENAEKLLLQLGIEKEKAEAAYYQALHQEKENRNILIHDIKNHLGVIAGLAEDGKNEAVLAYISEIKSTFISKDTIQRCNDPILDLILHRIVRECEDIGIRFYWDIRDCCDDCLDAADKTALFSNLLSNAVEAAKITKEKEIDFSIRCGAEGDSIVITTENSCGTKPVKDIWGQYRTSKDNAKIHGIGLRSIARIVKKCNGLSTMHYDDQTQKFYHVIYLKNNRET
jgi:hypothetical protein